MMRIGLIVDRYPPRPHTGIGTFVQCLAHGLSRRGHKVTVVDIGDEYKESSDDGIPVVTLRRSNLKYVGNLITRVRLRRWLADRVNAGKIEIIEVPDYPGLLPFAVTSCPAVVRLHQSCTVSHVLSEVKIPRGVSFYEKRTLIANPNWVAVSGHILSLTERVFGVFPRRSATIYNALPPAPTRLPDVPELPAEFVLYASQVSRRKGALILAEAARDFLSTHPELHLVYVGGCLAEEGSRPIEDEIRQVVGPGLTARVHFFGQVGREKVLACMKRAKVFAFPTRIDSFGLVVLEAMSCGAPVVFTKNSPGPEVVDDGVTGLLADPTSPRDFSEKITRLLDDPMLARRLSQKASECLEERFSLETCLDATERFYEECLRT